MRIEIRRGPIPPGRVARTLGRGMMEQPGRGMGTVEETAGNQYRELIRRIRQGDERPAEEIVSCYEPEICLEVRGWLRPFDPREQRLVAWMISKGREVAASEAVEILEASLVSLRQERRRPVSGSLLDGLPLPWSGERATSRSPKTRHRIRARS